MDCDDEKVKASVFNDQTFKDRIRDCQEIVHQFLQQIWAEHGGYKAVDSLDETDDAQDALVYLGKVVAFSRATVAGNGGEDEKVSQEKPFRIVALLRDIAWGRALLEGKKTVDIEDVQVCARIALSTMPAKRRPLVRALLDPENDGVLTTPHARDALGTSRPTALTRMEKMETLGLAHCATEEGDGRNPKRLTLRSEFQWPDDLEFPEFGGR